MKHIVCTIVLAFVILAIGAGQAQASTCTETGFIRDGINLTARLIDPGDVTGTVDATGCNIGIYYGPGAKAKVTNAEVFGANYFGIVNNGSKVDIKDSSVHDIGETPLNGSQHGVAIYFAMGDTSGTIEKNTISHYQKGGIVVNGTGASAKVRKNTVVGEGPVPYIAQNGIQISRGAKGEVTDNAVSGNAYTGAGGASSGGVLIFGGCGTPLTTHVDVHGNTLVNNDVGIFLFNGNDDCDGPPDTETKNSAHDNKISSDAVTNTSGDGTRGYQAGIDDVGVKDDISNNKISGAGYDERDDATAFVLPIDTTLATRAKVHHNKIS